MGGVWEVVDSGSGTSDSDVFTNIPKIFTINAPTNSKSEDIYILVCSGNNETKSSKDYGNVTSSYSVIFQNKTKTNFIYDTFILSKEMFPVVLRADSSIGIPGTAYATVSYTLYKLNP